MSASLVGSEMCIRDRFQGWYTGWSRCSALACSRSRARAHARARALAAAPVSYTHLTLPTICSV
eukprot:14237878-Alexandrium_andersonii.AAC.1